MLPVETVGCQFQIERRQLADHAPGGKVFTHEFAAGLAKPFAQRGLADKARHFFRQTGEVARAQQEAGFFVEAHFACAVAIVGDHGFAAGEGLGKGAGQSFAEGEVREQVHDADVPRHFFRRNEAGEDDVFFQAKGARLVFKFRPPGAIADEEKFDAGMTPDNCRRHGEQIVMALELEEARDFADHEIVRGNSELGAELRIIGGGEIRAQIEAAENFCVLFAAADSGGEILFRHGFRDGHKMSGNAASAPFGGAEKEICQGVLEIAEGGSVDGVDDEGHAGSRGGEAAEEAGFSAVSVDEVGPGFPKNTLELAQGQKILTGINRANEAGNCDQPGVAGCERAFRAGGGAGDELDIEVRALPQAEDGGQSIFLSSASDQTRDDVRDPHGRSRCGGFEGFEAVGGELQFR